MVLMTAAACSKTREEPQGGERTRFWHTFNSHETEALNALLEENDLPVEPALLPFARGQTLLAQVLRRAEHCPDLARIDATWLPALAEAKLLAPAPPSVATLLPEAAELTRWNGTVYGIPQSIDGLALIYDRAAIDRAGVDWPPPTLGALLAAAHRLSRGEIYGLGMRVDGYWFLAFLRGFAEALAEAPFPAANAGGESIASAAAAEALTAFAALFADGGVAPPPPPSGSEVRDEILRFRAGQLPVLLNGPWVIADLIDTPADMERLGVAPFPRAPRGGQVLIVPRCATHSSDGWKLAQILTEPALQARWSQQFGTVPTTQQGLAGAGRLAQEFYRALRQGSPLERYPAAAQMFDDLTPAVAAVVAGDATAEEALAGVARAWQRLLARHGGEAGAGDGAP